MFKQLNSFKVLLTPTVRQGLVVNGVNLNLGNIKEDYYDLVLHLTRAGTGYV